MRGGPIASDEAALQRMKKQRRHDTAPEIRVRRVLTRLGLRYRLNNRNLPGSPDLANRRRHWVIFVHGCFWHAHLGCPRHTIPKRNQDFWLAKFDANRTRDQRVTNELRSLGFDVIVVWECETKDEAALADRMNGLFKKK